MSCKVGVFLAALALGCATSLTHANAATFNFASLATTVGAQGGGEGFWSSQITTPGDVFTVAGIGVVASASGTSSSKAYLDGPFGGLPGGLGVCSTSGGCEGTSDDNVGRAGDVSGGALERLTLTFSTQVLLSDLLFNNRDHGLFNGVLGINGTNFTVANGHLVLALLGTVFNFDSLSCSSSCPGRDARDFYVGAATVSAVPLPPAILLFSSGLGLMAVIARRRKQRLSSV